MKAQATIRQFGIVAVLLFLLLAATVALAYVNLGAFNTPIALLISAAKATLIILFFMNLRRSSGATLLYGLAGFFWLLILLVLTFSDYLTR